jgi:hypothetical protein
MKTGEKLIPMIFALLKKSLGADKRMTITALLDSGASHSIIDKKCVKNLRLKNCSAATWNTAAGQFNTKSKCKVEFMLPELSPSANITHDVYVFEGKLSNYDMIIGRDLLSELGIDICFSEQTIKWPSMDT